MIIFFFQTNLMFSIFIITPVEKRTNPKGDYGTTYCIDSVTKSVKTLYIPIQLINKLKLNKYYLVTNAVVGDNVHLRDQTKVSKRILSLEPSKYQNISIPCT